MSAKRLAIMLVGLATLPVIFWLYITGAGVQTHTDRIQLIAAIWRHVGYGVALTPILIGAPLYLVWNTRGLNANGDILGKLATWALWIAAGCILLLAVTGPLVVWTYGADLKVFDWFVIGNPVGKQELVHEVLETGHGLIAGAAPWFAGLAGSLAAISLIRPASGQAN